MSSVHYKSDDEYSVIGDKGDIGFIDLDNCKTICSYNPSEESEIVHISVPFPLVEGKPQSGIVGETVFDTITLQNVTDGPLDLWSVSIYDAKPENSFTISVMEPPTAESDEHYIQDFMEAFTLEDRVLRTDEPLTIWLSCKPKEIGLHSAAVHFSVGDETIERLVFVLAEDKISQSLSSAKPFYRARKKKQNVVGVHTSGAEYVVGRRPTAGLNRGFRYRLPNYPIPENIREMLISGLIPDEVSEGLTKRNYVPFFKTLIAMEEIKLEEDMRAYDMESVIMKSKLNLLTLEVPGLAEKRPSLVNGDHIFVKSAFEQETAKAYQGFIHRVEAEEIFLKFQDKFHTSHRGSTLYNVQFTYNRTGIRRLYQAIEAAESLDRNFLFPSFAKARVTKTAPLVPMISCNLNEEQTSAIQMILACKGGVPYVIHGPPGTGKTMTLIEAILQVYSTRRNSRILVCAPSNSAADHILERLIRGKPGMLQPGEIFRLNAFTRPFEDLNPDFVDYCFVEDFIFKCPSRWELEQYRIIISTYTSASLLYVEGVKRGHFSYIFLDEAGQASEPDTMVPVSQLYTGNTVVVLAGDPRQLGPVVFSKDAESYGLGTSYLERLFQCELYSAGNSSFMTKLVKNYRTHPSILSLPSKLFYDGELIPCKEESRGLSTSWEDFLPNKEFPLLFVGIQGCDEREGSNPSWFNRIEASKVVETIRVLIEKKGLKEEEVGVITPYRQQVLKIRGALESINRPNIKVGSVEQFQGQEREVIIISTVRSTVKHNEFDQIHYLGFLSNSRRFNVAITRSRSLLIVIGNPHILCKDPNWNELLWYCVDNGSYKGCFLPEREEVYAAGPGTMHADTQYSNYEVGKSFQPSEGQWGDKGDNWQSPEVQWGEQRNSFQPSEGQWGDKGDDNWQSSEVQWGEQGNSVEASDAQLGEKGNNWQASDAQWDEQGNNRKASNAQWGEKGNNRKASNAQWGETGNNLAASDAQWGDKGNNWAASNAQWGGNWAASDAQWGDKRNNWAASNAQWGKKGNNWETSDSQWGGNGNNWQTSDSQWGGNGNNWESSEEQGVERENNWEPSKAQWSEKEDKREPSNAQRREKQTKREPSEARWRKKENKQEPSEVQLTKNMDNLKPFENKWGDDKDSLKAAEVQVSIEEKNNKQSAPASLTKKMYNLKPFEGKWGDDEDDWKAAEVQVSVEEKNSKQSAPSTQNGRNHFQPSDVPWE